MTTSAVVSGKGFRCFSEKSFCFMACLFASSKFGIRGGGGLSFLFNIHFSPIRKFYDLGEVVMEMWTFIRN